MINNIKIHQTVWFIENGMTHKGYYTGSTNVPYVFGNGFVTKACIIMDGIAGYKAINEEDLFESKAAAEKELQKQNREAINSFKKSIRTTKDLLQFPLKTPFYGNASCQNAKIAYMERAKEFGFDI